MFDEAQKAEAMGCVYKIEFIKEILDRHQSDVMTEREFYAIVLVSEREILFVIFFLAKIEGLLSPH